LAGASFAGAHETYLNIDTPAELLEAVKKCLASLFLERAIVYRAEKGFDDLKVALSVGIMKMVRSILLRQALCLPLIRRPVFAMWCLSIQFMAREK